MRQTSIFDGDGYQPPIRARRSDPETSREAADKLLASGAATSQLRDVLAALRKHPGCTAAELADAEELDRYTVSRRLPELVRMMLAVKQPARTCRVRKTSMLTWSAK